MCDVRESASTDDVPGGDRGIGGLVPGESGVGEGCGYSVTTSDVELKMGRVDFLYKELAVCYN
jgi:hypothetical protein